MSFSVVERQAPVRIYRSKLFVPGSKTNFFEKAAAGAADCVCLDLEDAVAPADKDKARDNVVAALNDIDWKGKIVTVRINGLDTGWCYKDVIALVEKGISAIEKFVKDNNRDGEADTLSEDGLGML